MAPESPIHDLLDHAPRLSAPDAQLVLMERYETHYRIFNHDVDTSNPLSLVSLHSGEDVCVGSMLYHRIEQFRDREVHKHFGLSFIEFMELPRDICAKILEVCGKWQTKEGQTASDLQNTLKGIVGS